jgi:UDP-2,3-diacylglucosamine pyrophosphatase LpxH
VTIYVVSDLHLDEDDGSRLFHDDLQGKALAELCHRVADERAELVLLGDSFDLTSMTPPARGLARFARTMQVPLRSAPPRDLLALLSAVRRSNPRGLEALAAASERGTVTIVPGNHDHHLAARRAPEALPAAGLPRARLELSPVREVAGRTVVLQHGHAFDPGNAKPGSDGEIVTQVMHQAVIPYLLAHGARPNVRMDADRIVALRPEEAVIPVLQRWLEPRAFRRLFLALVRLLADNGVVARPLAWVRRALTAEVVRRRVKEEQALWQRAGRAALRVLEGKRRLAHGAPRPDLLVLGHTHVLDWAVLEATRRRPERLYVNLGTWSERCYDAASPPDGSLPALRIAEERGALAVSLWDARSGEELQRFVGRDAASAPRRRQKS